MLRVNLDAYVIENLEAKNAVVRFWKAYDFEDANNLISLARGLASIKPEILFISLDGKLHVHRSDTWLYVYTISDVDGK